MVSDSITIAPIPSVASTKNLAKKKKGINRSTKLRQSRIEARREQWLSQGAVKSKGCKDGVESDAQAPPMPDGNHGKCSLEQLEMRHREEEDDGSIHHDSDSEFPSNSPTGNDSSGTNFTGSSSSRVEAAEAPVVPAATAAAPVTSQKKIMLKRKKVVVVVVMIMMSAWMIGRLWLML